MAITGGTVSINGTAAGSNAISGNVTVSGSGSLVFGSGASNANTANLTVASGGNLILGGAGAGTSQTVGTLTLTNGAGVDNIVFAGGTANTLTLSDIMMDPAVGVDYYAEILNWNGVDLTTTGSTVTRIALGSAAVNFFNSNVSDLGSIYWGNVTVGGTTYTNLYGAQIINGNQLVPLFNLAPVPEPTTVFGALLLLGLLAWRGRRQLVEMARGFLAANIPLSA
jgi:hypothetical protein